MKVAHICEESTFAILRSYLETLAKATHQHGVENVFILLKKTFEGSSLPLNSQEKNIYYVEMRNSFDFGAIIGFVQRVQSLKIDFIHAHDYLGQQLAVFSGFLTFKRSLYQVHGGDQRFDWLSRLNRFIVFDSQYSSQQFLLRSKIDKQKIRCIFPGVDEGKLLELKDIFNKNELREEMGIGKDSLVVVTSSNFVLENDYDTLLKVFRKLYAKEFDGYLLIVGQGALEGEIRQKIEEMRLGQKIKIINDPKKTLVCISLADIFISTAYKEDWPDFVFTAMALGKPIILSKIGKHTEIVNEGQNGFLAPCGFPERFENAVNRFFVNRSMLPEMSAKARKMYLEQFSLDVSAVEFLQLYQSK